MNSIHKFPIQELGYHFIDSQYLKNNETEYTQRFQQNLQTDYRRLSDQEIAILYSNGNKCSNWEHVHIKNDTNITLISECSFFGLVRIGNLTPYYLEFHDFKAPIGLYNSTIISCDLGDNVSIQNVKYLSHYIIEGDVILANINEMSCNQYAKFGNGILKEGEKEDARIWIELRNENGGRAVIPFEEMLPGDAWLWSKYRNSKQLMTAFKNFTNQSKSNKRGFYGTIGSRTVIKNTLSIKDVKIGTDAYIKGANKLKNLTILSAPDSKTQVGEGCELVNGIMRKGSKAFYGVKAVRFILGSFSQLKYGARLINSYLGDNATISCCEVLNSLIFPAHEQHHNNSFLCAALLKGQSNMAAGTTIGSNHNSRGADGEIEAGRGFWPGLCVSLKHNSKFASFVIIAKGDYPAELNIPFPFSLINNNVHDNILEIMPAYWLLHNMYAIVRNEKKFKLRDNRTEKHQLLEFDFLAPDTINEIVEAMELLQKFTGKAYFHHHSITDTKINCIKTGKKLLEDNDPIISQLTIFAEEIEHSNRKTKLLKVKEAYHVYKKMLYYYAALQTLQCYNHITDIDITVFQNQIKKLNNKDWIWLNVGGQLIKQKNIEKLISDCENGKIKSWGQIHEFYSTQANSYPTDKLLHIYKVITKISALKIKDINIDFITKNMQSAVKTHQWMLNQITLSKEKDFTNPFRQIVYDSLPEMETVVGSFKENDFIKNQKESHKVFCKKIKSFIFNH